MSLLHLDHLEHLVPAYQFKAIACGTQNQAWASIKPPSEQDLGLNGQILTFDQCSTWERFN